MNPVDSTEMKRLCQESDTISCLPDEVIQHILKFLPIQDAAKTAMLSRKWRNHWRNTPRLVFDSGFARITEQDRSASHVNKIMFSICKALLAHAGPITEFVLDIPGLSPCDETDLAVLHLSNKDMKKLSLIFTVASDEDDNYDRTFHSSLFSAVQLNCLQLEGGRLVTPSWFVGFSKLKALELVNLILPPDFFECFIPMCPLLEDLRISCCVGSHKFKLVAPRLKVFAFLGYILNISFKCTPLLSVVSIECDCGLKTEVEDIDIVAFFDSLPALQQLYMNLEFIDLFVISDRIPHKLPTPLYHLRVLGINNGTSIPDMPYLDVLFCLVRSSFRLETLTIKINTEGTYIIPKEPVLVEPESEEYLKEEEEGDEAEVRCLRELKIEGSREIKSELMLVKYVLETAKRLERIVVEPYYKLEWTKRYEFLQEVNKYKRASRLAEVIYV
ncbi:F-box/FBD/LRR-repeat protein At1g13570 [Linum perenne]